MRPRLRILSACALLSASHGVSLGQASEPPACPAASVARLGRPTRELALAAAAAAQSADPSCAVRGLAVADWLDQRGAAACAGADRLALERDEAPDLAALGAALEWRCGRPRAALESARRAVAGDPALTLAWRVLGQVLEARWRDGSARAAYERALAIDPAETGALLGLARLARERAVHRQHLERYLEVADERGEPEELIRAARETLDLLEALGERPIWVVERADLPGEIALEPVIPGPGQVAGWVSRFDFGAARRVPTLLDSGASGLHVDRRLLAASGVEQLATATLVGGGGAGEHAVARGLFDRATLGPVAFRSALGVFAEKPLHSRGLYRALVGFDVFGGTVIHFLPQQQRLLIEEAARPPDAGDPLTVDPWPLHVGELPLFGVEGQLLAPVTVSGPEGRADVLALIDTGAAASLLDQATADQLGSWRRGALVAARAYGGRLELAGQVRRLTLEIGATSAALRDVAVIDLSPRARLTGVHVGAFIGEDVWRRTGFVLDLAGGTIRALAP